MNIQTLHGTVREQLHDIPLAYAQKARRCSVGSPKPVGRSHEESQGPRKLVTVVFHQRDPRPLKPVQAGLPASGQGMMRSGDMHDQGMGRKRQVLKRSALARGKASESLVATWG